MKLAIWGPSGAGKTTAHRDKLSLDLEELDVYEARKDHYEWNKPAEEGGLELRKIRGEYYLTAASVVEKSNFPIISLHPSVKNIDGRRNVAAITIPEWSLLDRKNDKGEFHFTRERMMAMSMGFAKLVRDTQDKSLNITVAEGYVSDIIKQVFKEGIMSSDDWDLEIERISHSLNEAWAKLDEKYGYGGDQ